MVQCCIMSTETIRLFKPRMATTTFTQLLNSIRRHFNETAAASVLHAQHVTTRNNTLSFSRSVFFSRPLSPSSLSLSFLADAAVIGYCVYRPSRSFSGQLLRPHAHPPSPHPPQHTFFFFVLQHQLGTCTSHATPLLFPMSTVRG